MSINTSNSQTEKPTFLYIGASKAGSSWIFEILREHPEVFVPIAKEIEFFNKHYDRGIQWYLNFFLDGKGKKAIGEICHDYFLHQVTARRIREHLPDVRLICSLREPVEKTISNYFFDMNLTLDRNVTFREYMFQNMVLKWSDYYNNLSPFFQLFPRENILVLFYDDLRKDPQKFAQKIYKFIGVDATFEPQVLYQKVLPAVEPRFFKLAHMAYHTGRWLRSVGLANFVGLVKRNKFFRTIFYKELTEKPNIPEEDVYELRRYYAKRLSRLPELIGQDLPEEWGYNLEIDNVFEGK